MVPADEFGELPLPNLFYTWKHPRTILCLAFRGKMYLNQRVSTTATSPFLCGRSGACGIDIGVAG